MYTKLVESPSVRERQNSPTISQSLFKSMVLVLLRFHEFQWMNDYLLLTQFCTVPMPPSVPVYSKLKIINAHLGMY